VVVWSAAAAALAGPLPLGVSPTARAPAALAAGGTVALALLAVLLIAHAAAAALERHWTARPTGDAHARPAAGLTVAAVLAVAGTLPFWLGPAAELAARQHPAALDLVVAWSPVTHLAVASGHDILRQAWLYEHANLAALPVEYPAGATLAWAYAAALALLVIAALRPWRPLRLSRRADTRPPASLQEHAR
jgi:hypothetical protein